MVTKAFFLVMLTVNSENIHTPHHIGRLPNWSFAEVIVKQVRKQKKINNKDFGGYLCMSSKNYFDNEFPYHKVLPKRKWTEPLWKKKNIDMY